MPALRLPATEFSVRLGLMANRHPEGKRVLSYARVLEVARTMFLEQMTLDMQSLAQRLAVSRATLYRVVSSRERLLADVIWSLSVASLQASAGSAAEEMDIDAVLRIGRRFRERALVSEPMKRFVAEEPSTAAAVLHTRSAVRDQLVDEWEHLLLRATGATTSPLSIDPKHAAEIIVSLGASMLYDDLVSGTRRTPDLVEVVLRSLFRA